MSLRFKSLLLFSVAVTLLFAIVVGLVKIIIERQFTDIERDKMLQQAERFTVDLLDELAAVSSVVTDWASPTKSPPTPPAGIPPSPPAGRPAKPCSAT